MNPSANAPDGQPHAEAVTRVDTQNVSPPVQAAQLSHKVETVDALVVGQSPKPPKKPKKRKSNKFTFRGDNDLLNAITDYAAAAGLNDSDAARQLIENGLGQSRIVITPKSPPDHLEFFVGALKAWGRDFTIIKSRLNAPMPQTDDARLTELVTKWRVSATKLLADIPMLAESANAEAALLTSLDSEKITALREFYPTLLKWIADREAALAKEGQPQKEINSHKKTLAYYNAMKSVIVDLGIIKTEGSK